MSTSDPRWAYLDFESPEVTVERDGVTTVNGQIALARVPATPQALGAELEAEPSLAGPAGIAIDTAGNIYVAHPAENAVVRIDGCDGSVAPVRCLALSEPRGVAVGSHDELYVSDSGNHRVVVVDLGSGQTIGIWGSADPYGPGTPSDEPGFLNEPTDLAVDSDARLYVVEHGNGRVQRFAPTGRVEPEFWDRVSRGRPRPTAPEAVAVATFGSEERVLVIDRRSSRRFRVLVFRADGTIDAALTRQLRDQGTATTLFKREPGGIAAGDDAIYIGDASRNRVLVFDTQGKFVAAVPTSHGTTSGLALDERGRLVVNAGGGASVLFAGLGPVTSGTLMAGPFALPRAEEASLVGVSFATAELPSGGQLQLYAWPAGEPADEPPPLPAPGTAADDWLVGALNAPALVFDRSDSTYIWIAVRLEAGDGGAPVLGRGRIESGLEAWLYDIPALYARDNESRPFLERLLALFRAGFAEQQRRIDDLPLLLDADTAPDASEAGLWLDWLAGWVAFPLGDVRAAARRAAVRGAFSFSGRRGTAGGLGELIRLAFEASSWVSEPAQRTDPWMLDGNAALGLNTALVPAEAQGAVVGTTSTLDRSHLIDEADFGAPLFDDLAHHFCVGVYASDVSAPQDRAALTRLVDRARPAHTTAHVCIVEPRARVGFQARLGIDAIVARLGAPLRLGEEGRLSADARLPDGRQIEWTLNDRGHVRRMATKT